VRSSRPDQLFRFGLEPETVQELALQAAAAENRGFPHGVSVFSRSDRPDRVTASVEDVEEKFALHKTGVNPFHFTIELPKPVTQSVADLFNGLFSRATHDE
jgi:hypothetical protein